jgi:3-methyladenine DNA glycosylase AlkD
MKNEIIASIKKELKQNIDENTRNSTQRYFKEPVKLYGVNSALVCRIGNKYFREIKHKEKKEIFSLCEELLESGYIEEAFIAFDWAYGLRRQYEKSDFEIFEAWLNKYVTNWAECDTLCNHSIGAFIEQYPVFIKGLKKWTKSKNRWVRRASAVTLILPARKGKFLKDIFIISDSLLNDKDDLVQKGYGWMLKEASKLHQKEVFEYIMEKKKELPRTALRYAIEKMPENLRAAAMKKPPGDYPLLKGIVESIY